MKVSVIVRSKNNRETIESCILGLLTQSRLPDEIIVVDNSTDGTDIIAENLLKGSGVKYKIIKQDKQGLGYATHLGITNSSGDIIITTDGDTVLSKDVIKHTVEALSNKDVTVVGATSYPIRRSIVSAIFTPFTAEKFAKSPCGRFMAFRKDDYVLTGGLMVNGLHHGYYEDHIIASKLKELGRAVILEDPVFTEIPTTTQKIVVGKMVSMGLIATGVVDAALNKRYYIDIPLMVAGSIFLYFIYKKRGTLGPS